MENGFKIIDEKIVFEYKYYQILVVENGEMKLTEEQILFGPYLLKEKSKTFRNYYHSQIKKIKRIIKRLMLTTRIDLNLKNNYSGLKNARRLDSLSIFKV